MEKIPLFIKVDHYEDVLDVIGLIKEKLGGIKQSFEKIEHLKSEEDAKIESWHRTVEEIEARLGSIEHSLFEQG
jgi:hypothetical protein